VVGQISEPEGCSGSSVIETATLHLRPRGSHCAPVRLVQLSSRTAMLIRRFDRYWAKQVQMPAAGGSSEHGSSVWPSREALGLSAVLRFWRVMSWNHRTVVWGPGTSDSPVLHPSVIRENNRELFERLVFNIFVNNDDDHLRNHGFVWDVRLPAGGSVRSTMSCREQVWRRTALAPGRGSGGTDRNPRQRFAVARCSRCLRSRREHREIWKITANGRCTLNRTRYLSIRSRRSHRHFGTSTLSRRRHCVS